MSKKELSEQEMIDKEILPPWGLHKGNIPIQELNYMEVIKKMSRQEFKKMYPLEKLPPLKQKRQRKREERLNTCAGIPAKRRQLVKLLKRRWKILGLSAQNVMCVKHLSAIRSGHITEVMSLRNKPMPHFDSGKGIFGYVACHATQDGIKDWMVKIDPMTFIPKNEGLPLL